MPEKEALSTELNQAECQEDKHVQNRLATSYECAPAPGNEDNQATEFDIFHVRRVVAGNPNTPDQVLSRLAADTMSPIRRRVAENPRTPAAALRILAKDNHCDVRLAVAENPNTPPDILAMLADDDDADVRYGVAENPHMPEHILLKLSEDENPYIRCRALKTLQMLSPTVQSRLKFMLQQVEKKIQ